ncbi:fused signal recognition particle receptor [Mesorhizobium sp. J18]|uniref:signal recognition particle-docking protein FtsY n=1 Tax=Mesorhizobium sp. J18 TaxID=935263 RepID=UPI00119BCA64|nr:signal recognition particle-docking protein FtsY [Mesorhizobium sp. J18]TWG97984.1 fused signal recognition particle receptor [Mesorhizobium sp. J18]
MAFGLIKKIFSFGKKAIEEVPADGMEAAQLPASEPARPETPGNEPAPGPRPQEPPPAEPETPEPPKEPEPVPAPEPETAPPPEPEQVPAPVPQEVPTPAPERPAEVPPEPRPVPEVPIEKPEPAPEPSHLEELLAREPGTSAESSAEMPSKRELEPQNEPLPEEPEPSPPEELPVRQEAPETEAPAPGLPVDEEPVEGDRPDAVEEEVFDQEQLVPEASAIPELPIPAEPRPAGKVTVSRTVERREEPVQAEPQAAPRLSWLQRMRQGLSRSSRELADSISGVFTKGRLTDEIMEDLEDVLIRADLGVETAMRITDKLASGRYGRQTTEADVRAVMAEEITKVLDPVALPLELDLSHKPHVILVVGVNGTGKTTTIGKLAAKLTQGGLSVMLAAGDTFRAAAIEQLKIWGERTGSPVISSKLGADAAGLAWDAYVKAREAGSDVLIIDTAGRLQNKAELMAELEKIVRVLGRHDPDAPHTVLQTVDATTGQNALNQVEIFRNVAGVNGLVMTKLDGTARGGILVAIAAKHKLPVYFIGVGEQVDDLEPFSASDFAKAIAGVQ